MMWFVNLVGIDHLAGFQDGMYVFLGEDTDETPLAGDIDRQAVKIGVGLGIGF